MLDFGRIYRRALNGLLGSQSAQINSGNVCEFAVVTRHWSARAGENDYVRGKHHSSLLKLGNRLRRGKGNDSIAAVPANLFESGFSAIDPFCDAIFIFIGKLRGSICDDGAKRKRLLRPIRLDLRSELPQLLRQYFR